MTKKSKKLAMGQLLDPDDFVKDCREVIEKTLNYKHIGFNEQRGIPGNRKLYILTGAEATQAEAKYKYAVIPFFKSQNGIYWLAASLEFEFRQGIYLIVSVSLLIFKGEATDNRKSALLRAEWACPQKNDLARHAQPHWHIYPSHINKESAGVRTEFKADAEIQTFDPEALEIEPHEGTVVEWERAEKFHFAMAARWHSEGNDAHQEKMQAGGILKWLEGCIKYTRDQFTFLYR
ncbi:hypothetical protein L0337_12670 [candidate division KSB1 bacterium]|nr:hypothetical protein [candidate division KSB1 bacterium]